MPPGSPWRNLLPEKIAQQLPFILLRDTAGNDKAKDEGVGGTFVAEAKRLFHEADTDGDMYLDYEV